MHMAVSVATWSSTLAKGRKKKAPCSIDSVLASTTLGRGELRWREAYRGASCSPLGEFACMLAKLASRCSMPLSTESASYRDARAKRATPIRIYWRVCYLARSCRHMPWLGIRERSSGFLPCKFREGSILQRTDFVSPADRGRSTKLTKLASGGSN